MTQNRQPPAARPAPLAGSVEARRAGQGPPVARRPHDPPQAPQPLITEEAPSAADVARLAGTAPAQHPAERLRAAVAKEAPTEGDPDGHPLDQDVDTSLEGEDIGAGGSTDPDDEEDERGVPRWAAGAVPEGFVFPQDTIPIFIRCDAYGPPPNRRKLTRDGKSHVVVMWELDVKDERLAKQRTRGDSTRTIEELTKQTIRLFDDGERADWGGKAMVGAAPGNVDKLWNAIGAPYRSRLIGIYLSSSSMTGTEAAHFFTRCVRSRHAAP